MTPDPRPPAPDPGPERLGYVKALDGSPLYAAYHAAKLVPLPPPARGGGEANRFYPVVILPPLFEERKSAYAALRKLACRLAAAGHAVLRFDYRGSGESGGDPGVRRWSHLAEDAATARKTLARLAGKRDSVLLGLRMGGTLALQETARVGGEAVIAIAPVVSGAAQVRLWKMRSIIRAELTGSVKSGKGAGSNIAASGTLDFDGYDVNTAFFDDVAAIDLRKDLGPLSCPGLVVQLSHKAAPNAESEQLLAALGRRARLEALRMEPFWDKLDDVDTGPMEDVVLKNLEQFE